VIIVTGAVGEDTAVELFKSGATDFVLKDRLSERLAPVIKRAMEEASNRETRRRIEEKQDQLVADLRYLATHDHLTGSASRPLVLKKLEQAVRDINPEEPDTVFSRSTWTTSNSSTTPTGCPSVTRSWWKRRAGSTASAREGTWSGISEGTGSS